MPSSATEPANVTIQEIGVTALIDLLAPYGIEVVRVEVGEPIPGSYWGDPEAGLIGRCLYVRSDTPVQSALHEACHCICMTPDRRADLHTDAGGGYDEEDAVCYLQILLADQLPGMGRELMYRDMDRWGYTFRLGSAEAWFGRDADDAAAWLVREGLLTKDGKTAPKLRGD